MNIEEVFSVISTFELCYKSISEGLIAIINFHQAYEPFSKSFSSLKLLAVYADIWC